MVVIGVEGSMLLQSVHHIPRLQSTTSSSPLFSSSQQQQHYRGLSSSSASYSGSSSSSVSFPHLTYSSSSSSSASVGDTAIQRRISIGGAPRSKSRETIAGIGYGGAVAVANPSRPAIAYRPAAFVSGPSARVVHAAVAETSGEGLKWWEKGGAPNMVDVHSTHEFLNALSAAGDKLVIVKFYATWCGSCRALFPKFSKMATEYTDVNFLKVNFDENKPMCKSLNIKVLPFFHIYRGSEGRLESFSASLSKLQKLKDAISKHHDGPCEDCAPPELLGDVFASLQERASAERAAGAAGSLE